MPVSKTDSALQGRSKTSKGEETRERIILATLNIIMRDGMRSVRHRAVAAEAGVPLGATTYHFKDIEDLIVSAFSHWCNSAEMTSKPYVTEIVAYLEANAPRLRESHEGRMELAVAMYRHSIAYELDQIESGHDNRVIELAFYHESLHNDRLRQQVFAYWQTELDGLTSLYEAIGSPSPEADARIAQSVFHQLEREAMMLGDAYELDTIKKVLRRLIGHALDVDLGGVTDI